MSTAAARFRGSHIEDLVRDALSRRVRFRAQHPVGPYRADFYVPRFNLVIECDGAPWHTHLLQKIRDRRRDAYMRARGYRVVRLSGSEIVRDVRRAVDAALRAGLPGRRPPAPATGAKAPRLRDEEEV